MLCGKLTLGQILELRRFIRVVLRSTPVNGSGTHGGWSRGRRWDVFSGKASADPMGSSGAEAALQHWPQKGSGGAQPLQAGVDQLLAEAAPGRQRQLSSVVFSQSGPNNQGLPSGCTPSSSESKSFISEGVLGDTSRHLPSHGLSPSEKLAQADVLFLV